RAQSSSMCGGRPQSALRRLFSFPPRASRSIFEKHTACRQIGANPVGGSEIAASPRGLPILDEPLDVLDRNGRPLILGAPQADDAEHLVEVAKGVGHRDGVVA